MTIMVNNSLLTLLAQCETKTWLRWGQELVVLPLPAGAPQSAIRPHLEVCDRALTASAVSGEPGR